MPITLMKYFHGAGQLYSRMLQPVREKAGLTQGELDILLFLANNPGYDTASDIVALRRLAKSNVSVGVRRLESRGMLRRRTDERDQRLEHLLLTPAAGPVAEAGREAQRRFSQALTEGLSPGERAELDRLMGHIYENLSRALEAAEGRT